jgi:formylglycine-generating enzyme required for sulfatase activity
VDDLALAPERPRSIGREVAIERIANFAQKFGEPHLILACHAAFPLVLTPELVYQLWANFTPETSWTATADLLLSGLCQEVGTELYEMDSATRNILLTELKEDEHFGQRRLDELADFLIEYVAHQLESDDPEVSYLTQAQRWTALAYIRPVEAARKLALALSEVIGKNDAELIRVASLVETLSEPLAAFEILITYATGIASWTRGEIKRAATKLGDLPIQHEQIQALETSLPIPAPLLREINDFKRQSSKSMSLPSISSRDIITGLKIDNLNVIFSNLDALTQALEYPRNRFRVLEDGHLKVLADTESLLTLPPNHLEAFKLLPRAADLPSAERHRAYAAWLVTRRASSPVQRVAARDHYVALAGHLSWDWDDDPMQPQLSYLRPIGEKPEQRFERELLTDVTAAVTRFPAFILLGPPGSGKSTALEHLVYTTARDYLRGGSRRLPLWVTLAGYRWQQQRPVEFIQAEWAAKVNGDFVELARSGQVLLLIDGLNEMPRLAHPDDRVNRAVAWKHFIDEYFVDESVHGSRLVIASRDANDYEQRLGLPRVEIDALTPAQVERFAAAYLNADTGPFMAELRALDLSEQTQNPFALFILTQLYRQGEGRLPANRGRMFAQYAAGLLSVVYPFREKERQAALQALAHLGYALQERGEGTVLPAGDLVALLPSQVRLSREAEPLPTPPVTVFNHACRAGLFSLVDEAADSYKFTNQFLQEIFAAQQLLARWQAGEDHSALWQIPRALTEIPVTQVDEWDPLPPPPSTGWEQTTILAAGLTNQPDAFIRAVLAVNSVLAGRCVVEGGLVISPNTRAAVQNALLRDLSDPTLHRRTRLTAGRVLAQVGDPRLIPAMFAGVRVISPSLVEVSGGTATLGSAEVEASDNEKPVHYVDVTTFYLARHLVTNAEYQYFIQAGGYDTEQYWSLKGWEWRQGKQESNTMVEEVLSIYRYFSQNPNIIEKMLKQGSILPDQAATWRELLQLSEDQVRQQLSQQYPIQSHEYPYHWNDMAYNAPNQPVVGVTWYEAMAYCAWLQEQVTTNHLSLGTNNKTLNGLLLDGRWQIRLPTEAEWEWAAGGLNHSVYPWGQKFDPDRTNTLEGRVLSPTPVGAYPAGAAECGALDMSGNVWEWTHSSYQNYPYQREDGREDTSVRGRRTIRGGTWDQNQRSARISYRTSYQPDYFSNNVGFRLAVGPVLN